ncbi:MAG TPA: class I SAM-dependent methyltransferase [Oceanobacillus sp.]|nr:class I SAM-dependent methyltransferase [Oceanobacillus sp.]
MLPRLKHLLRRPVRTLPSLSAYERWAVSYPPHAHNALMELEQATMLNLLPSLAGLAILDLACGTGRYALLARERGANLVVGADNSAAMLNAAPSSFNRAQATTEAIPLASNSMDGVLCGLALGHLPQIELSIREIGRILKSGGWALISDVHPAVVRKGAQRTFTAPDGKVYAVEHYLHQAEDYARAAQQAGLVVDVIQEPVLPNSSDPVVLVLRLAKR